MTQEAGKSKPANVTNWEYCPECGKAEIRNRDFLGAGSRRCSNCGQEWWLDVDYSDVVRNNLTRLYAQQREQPAPTPESQWPTEAVEAFKSCVTFIEEITDREIVLNWSGLEKAQAAIQWLQTSGVREGTGERPKKRNPYLHLLEQRGELNKELKECLEELVKDFSVLMKTYMKLDPGKYDLITKAKSLLNPDQRV